MIQVGAANWVRDLKGVTDPLGPNFWSEFTPATEAELREAEKQLGRTLDAEFREFYLAVGYGYFPIFGGFDPPSKFIHQVGSPIYFITGSLTPGAEWATEDEHQRLWLSRGLQNPDPARFTDETLTLEGVKLYDLLLFGGDGVCCYHCLYIGPEPAPLRYCLLTSFGMEDPRDTFSEGLWRILELQLEENEDNEDDKDD
jgi:hypothetical protein